MFIPVNRPQTIIENWKLAKSLFTACFKKAALVILIGNISLLILQIVMAQLIVSKIFPIPVYITLNIFFIVLGFLFLTTCNNVAICYINEYIHPHQKILRAPVDHAIRRAPIVLLLCVCYVILMLLFLSPVFAGLYFSIVHGSIDQLAIPLKLLLMLLTIPGVYVSIGIVILPVMGVVNYTGIFSTIKQILKLIWGNWWHIIITMFVPHFIFAFILFNLELAILANGVPLAKAITSGTFTFSVILALLLHIAGTFLFGIFNLGLNIIVYYELQSRRKQRKSIK